MLRLRSFQSVKAEIDKKTGHNLGEEFEAIKKELADIHAAAHRDTDARGKKLADLHSDIENVHKSAAGGDISGHLDSLSRSNEKMLDQLASQHKNVWRLDFCDCLHHRGRSFFVQQATCRDSLGVL